MTARLENNGPQRPSRQHGVTLVEMMVGMLIGMLAVMIISQVLLTSEGQKRTAAGGADAQINGALALYTMQRDLEQAGYGISSSPDILGCSISARYNGSSPTGFASTLAPVVITPQASRPAGSVGDSIRVLGSSPDALSIPARVVTDYTAGGSTFAVRSSVGFTSGHLALVSNKTGTGACWVFKVTAASAASLTRGNDVWNAAGMPNVPYADGDVMLNLGTLVDNRYEISNSTLQVSSFDFANPNTRVVSDLQPDIVQLRAYYGRDTSSGTTTDGVIDTFDTTTPTTALGWQKVLAVRIIAVARSSTYERDEVTTANLTWPVGTSPSVSGATSCTSGSCITLDVGADTAGSAARHYRYKVFDTVVPLRNLLWRSAS